MDPSIVTHAPFVVLGMQIDTRPMSPAIAELWSRFVQREHEITGVVESGVSYGVMQSHVGEPDGLRYLAGLRVAEPSTPLPAGMSAVSIPGGLYAVFEFPFSEIGPAFDFMFNAWLPGSGFVAARSPMFERYGQDFDPSGPVTRMQAHIPLMPRTAGA